MGLLGTKSWEETDLKKLLKSSWKPALGIWDQMRHFNCRSGPHTLPGHRWKAHIQRGELWRCRPSPAPCTCVPGLIVLCFLGLRRGAFPFSFQVESLGRPCVYCCRFPTASVCSFCFWVSRFDNSPNISNLYYLWSVILEVTVVIVFVFLD